MEETTAVEPMAPVDDQRAPDQDGAMEVAFVEGTLPEADRRTGGLMSPEAASFFEGAAVDPIVEDVIEPDEADAVDGEIEQDLHDVSPMARAAAAEPAPILEELHESQVVESLAAYAMLSAGGVGTTIERQTTGWKVKYMSGGTALLSSGESLGQALGVS